MRKVVLTVFSAAALAISTVLVISCKNGGGEAPAPVSYEGELSLLSSIVDERAPGVSPERAAQFAGEVEALASSYGIELDLADSLAVDGNGLALCIAPAIVSVDRESASAFLDELIVKSDNLDRDFDFVPGLSVPVNVDGLPEPIIEKLRQQMRDGLALRLVAMGLGESLTHTDSLELQAAPIEIRMFDTRNESLAFKLHELPVPAIESNLHLLFLKYKKIAYIEIGGQPDPTTEAIRNRSVRVCERRMEKLRRDLSGKNQLLL